MTCIGEGPQKSTAYPNSITKAGGCCSCRRSIPDDTRCGPRHGLVSRLGRCFANGCHSTSPIASSLPLCRHSAPSVRFRTSPSSIPWMTTAAASGESLTNAWLQQL